MLLMMMLVLETKMYTVMKEEAFTQGYNLGSAGKYFLALRTFLFGGRNKFFETLTGNTHNRYCHVMTH